MKGLSGFFDKFKNTALKELNKREVIITSIYKITKQKIDIKDISIINDTISIKGDRAFKSEIFLKKKTILDLILKETKVNFRDIK